ncbi:hypothetical protein B0H16DRAFT_1638790 [Mycena metata]|uniref:Uncharacterized protein n=1 Tax=Mycena metata TaxID=1033252 RepID=A0AAD7GNW4_9AGAR|nr:hypothetical protein B0H16DRAFT_1638790 [Mycena metata]
MFAFQLLSALSSMAFLDAATPAGLAPDTCSAAAAKMDLPANQSQLVSPTTDPLFVLLGVGVQNYTCSASTLTYTLTLGFDVWKSLPASFTADDFGAKIGPPLLLGVCRCRVFSSLCPNKYFQFHYFVTSPSGTDLSPKWDFTSTGKFAGNSSAFVLGAKVGDITAPADPVVNLTGLRSTTRKAPLPPRFFALTPSTASPPHL